MDSHARIAAVRNAMLQHGLDGYMLPVTDEYQGEYSADYARRVTWLTGFDGSAGMVIILRDTAALLVDGRYVIQAAQEVDTSLYEVPGSADITLAAYLSSHKNSHTNVNMVIGYDPWLHTMHGIQQLTEKAPCSFTPLPHNLIDNLREDQPPRPNAPVTLHDIAYAGASQEEKIARVIAAIDAPALLLTEPDAICWLLNIRGGDIPYNPLPLCYALVQKDGQVYLIIQADKVADSLLPPFIHIIDDADIVEWLDTHPLESIQLDPRSCPVWFAQQCRQRCITIHEAPNPVTALKAIKNATEIEGIKRAHAIDGRAVTAFSRWLNALDDDQTITELEIIDKLEYFRRQSPEYLQPSFATIAGAGAHGAIVHYRATEHTNRALNAGEALLVDSGGQYRFGTTDITRTFFRGTPNGAFKRHYTLVLKGHIALAEAIFPEGTTGHQLDALARQFLWREGLDYQHGTGHGVGHYLCVHEGPQGISARANPTPLQPGMILSNEPGFYLEGQYGIRIESLMLVIEKHNMHQTRYFGFDTLSRAPIDSSLIDASLMTPSEWRWLEEYHAKIEDTLI
ncbi:MAG: aminopeptidase P family protein [Sphaerospermopsis sp. SIO1G2]|nr:aminopeptidase P family protein [Sphaerospermopsis sp. SIO1G2]